MMLILGEMAMMDGKQSRAEQSRAGKGADEPCGAVNSQRGASPLIRQPARPLDPR